MDEERQSDRVHAAQIRVWTVGSLAGALGMLLIFEVIQLRDGDWAGALALSVALVSGGYLIGLLFAVPRTTGSDAVASAPAGDVKQPDGQRTATLQRRILLVNTSFEQISDWLTKIIVGVGLVQFQPILTFMQDRTSRLAADFAGPHFEAAHAEPLAAGILIACPGFGVLLGFFSVRLYIAWAIYVADAEATRPVEQSAYTSELRIAAAAVVAPTDLGSRDEVQDIATDLRAPVSQDASAAIGQILSVPLEKLSTAEDIVAWGRANLASGSYLAAGNAFFKALTMAGDDPKTVLNYVEALYHIDPVDYQKIVGALQRALGKLDSTVDPQIRQRVNEELLNAYLYTAKPTGFSNAIQLCDQYVASDGRNRYASYVYLAAAHGQRYAYYKDAKDSRTTSELKVVADVIRSATNLGGESARRWLLRMTKPGVDDDLVAAYIDSQEVRDLLNDPS